MLIIKYIERSTLLKFQPSLFIQLLIQQFWKELFYQLQINVKQLYKDNNVYCFYFNLPERVYFLFTKMTNFQNIARKKRIIIKILIKFRFFYCCILSTFLFFEYLQIQAPPLYLCICYNKIVRILTNRSGYFIFKQSIIKE